MNKLKYLKNTASQVINSALCTTDTQGDKTPYKRKIYSDALVNRIRKKSSEYRHRTSQIEKKEDSNRRCCHLQIYHISAKHNHLGNGGKRCDTFLKKEETLELMILNNRIRSFFRVTCSKREKERASSFLVAR